MLFYAPMFANVLRWISESMFLLLAKVCVRELWSSQGHMLQGARLCRLGIDPILARDMWHLAPALRPRSFSVTTFRLVSGNAGGNFTRMFKTLC